jgi:predicted DNA binding CopG/RHH family protein
MRTARPALYTKGDAVKQSNKIEAEAAFAAEVCKDRAALNLQAQAVLPAAESRQITIRLRNSEIALAKIQAEAKGLKYQTYIKMLLHEALTRQAEGMTKA